MNVLDCESVATTYNSIANLFGTDRKSLEIVFENLDVEKLYIDNPRYPEPPDDYVFSLLRKNFTFDISILDKICWFHLTRVSQPETFYNKGILPLSDVINDIWTFLYTLIDHKISLLEWKQFRENLSNNHSSQLYNMKIKNSMHWGPYAILVRELAFKAKEIDNHDYLRTPEIVEDICQCCYERFEIDLLNHYIENTKPCIVKFIDDDVRLDYVNRAIYYLYNTYKGNKYSLYCSTNYDSRAKKITREKILKIELINLS